MSGAPPATLDRATPERSPQAVSAVPGGIPGAKRGSSDYTRAHARYGHYYGHSFDLPRPKAMAFSLSYLKDPARIRAAVIRELGSAPSLEWIAGALEYKKAREAREYPDLEPYEPKVRRPSSKPGARRYANGGTVYVPAHVELPSNDDSGPVPTIRTHTDTVKAVAEAFGLTYAEITSPRRFTKLICARAVAARILHERGNSYPAIGRYLGGRDHSTTINAVRSFDDRARKHPEMLVVYDRLTAAPESEAA